MEYQIGWIWEVTVQGPMTPHMEAARRAYAMEVAGWEPRAVSQRVRAEVVKVARNMFARNPPAALFQRAVDERRIAAESAAATELVSLFGGMGIESADRWIQSFRDMDMLRAVDLFSDEEEE